MEEIVASEILSEVETCMLRIALRRMAEQTPRRVCLDDPVGAQDYHRLAGRLARFRRAEISQYTGART